MIDHENRKYIKWMKIRNLNNAISPIVCYLKEGNDSEELRGRAWHGIRLLKRKDNKYEIIIVV